MPISLGFNRALSFLKLSSRSQVASDDDWWHCWLLMTSRYVYVSAILLSFDNLNLATFSLILMISDNRKQHFANNFRPVTGIFSISNYLMIATYLRNWFKQKLIVPRISLPFSSNSITPLLILCRKTSTQPIRNFFKNSSSYLLSRGQILECWLWRYMNVYAKISGNSHSMIFRYRWK